MSADFSYELQTLAKRHADKPRKTFSCGQAIWIFGAGQFGRDLCGALQRAGHTVAGFVETKPAVAQVLGLPLINWQQWSPAHCAAPLCIGIFNRGMPLDVLEALAHTVGASEVFMPWDFFHAFQEDLGWRYWLSEPERILNHTEAIVRALDCLSDDTSKRCLLDIVAFRLGLNTAYGSFRHSEKQYFNDITLGALSGKPISFVDGGAYNGDTYLELCGVAEVQMAFLFEPDGTNFSQLLRNVHRTTRPLQCLPLGLSDSYRILHFSAGSGEGASITETGSGYIAVTALDDVLVGQTVDFIKLDVEGAELQALQGAKELIQRSCPVLALSLYHRPQDLWEIPLAIAAMCNCYSLYIRQHYFNSFDSVLYAIPR